MAQDTFADYTARTSFERPLLSGVAYAQRVKHADRDAFERQQGWIIKTMKHEPSPEQDEYAPVIYSQETISYIEGLDMMSGEVCAAGVSFFGFALSGAGLTLNLLKSRFGVCVGACRRTGRTS
jgi:hypothetical protein